MVRLQKGKVMDSERLMHCRRVMVLMQTSMGCSMVKLQMGRGMDSQRLMHCWRVKVLMRTPMGCSMVRLLKRTWRRLQTALARVVGGGGMTNLQMQRPRGCPRWTGKA
jgi:hypothetical protein